MARILIAGCGYVGEAAAESFLQKRWEVEGWTSSKDSAARLNSGRYQVRALDLTDHAAVAAVSGEFDVVVQCASTSGGDAEDYRRLYLGGARNLLRRFPASRFLFTSSTSVYAQQDGTVVDEACAAEPTHEKGKILREAEDLVLAAGGIVARLGGIHGPERSFFLSNFLEGRAVIDPDNERFINQAHRDDIASAFLLLAEKPFASKGEIFNVVGDEAIRASEAYEWLSVRLGRPLPSSGERAVSRKRGQSNKQVSNAKLRALGWVPRYPTFHAAMSKSILPSFGF